LRNFKNSETSAQKIVAYVEYPEVTFPSLAYCRGMCDAGHNARIGEYDGVGETYNML
jgi:hypothetical protein